MKILSRICLACLCLGTVGALCAAEENQTPPYKDKWGKWVLKNATFKRKSGYLDSPKSWHGDKLPSPDFPLAYLPPGVTITLSEPYPGEFATVYLCNGEGKKCTLVLNNKALLSVGSMMVPNPYLSQTPSAEVLMSGGTLLVGELKGDKPNNMLGVGASETYSGCGRFVISGGTLTATIFVGSTVDNTASGSFVVEGSQPVIACEKKKLAVAASGTLEFVLDENGIATMDYGKSTVQLRKNATVRADGSRYKGPPKTFLLVRAGEMIRSNPLNLEVTGFAAPYQATLSFERQGLTLKVQKTK